MEVRLILNAGPFSGSKILCHLDRLHELLSGGNPAPIGIEIDLTNACNVNCGHCTNADLRSPVSLERGFITDILTRASLLGTDSVTFTGGGEPTLSPQLVYAIVTAIDLDFEVGLFTNGVVRPTKALLKQVPGMTWIRVSLDAYDRESYAAVHGVPGEIFDRVLDNIRLYVANKGTCTIGVGYLTGGERDKGILKAADLCRDLGVDYLQFRPVAFSPCDSRYESDRQSDYNRSFLMAEAALLSMNEHYRVLVSPRHEALTEEQGYSKCWGVYFSCVIGATGDVYACCHLRGSRYSLGNVHQTGFDQIWNDMEKRESIYKSIQMDKDCVPRCKFHQHNQIVQEIVDARGACEHRNFL